MTHWIPMNSSLPSTTTINMSSANNNASGASGSGRNKGKGREMLSDIACRVELERQQADLVVQMAALQEEIAQLKSGDDKADDGDDDNSGDDEEDDDEREEETNTGRKHPAPEEGGERREPEKKRRRKHYGPDVPNQWEADPFVPCTACASRSSECLPIPDGQFAGSSCERCRRKKVKCSFVPLTEKSRVNRREKEKTGKPAGKSGQSTPRISGAGLTRMTAVEIRLGIETGVLYRIAESKPPMQMPPPPVPKVERLTSPQLVFKPDKEPNKGTAGPGEERAEQCESGEGAPEEVQPAEGALEEEQPGEEQPGEEQLAEAMEVDVPEK
ncbi:hypothetical protein GGX14DRAFT_556780 [Mycena pura]|uniref:Zn(2)-C6 fungal-type domain-containing protein n=1 Tax=Mycena pura TaxID=153505 RepID=A0AAD6YQ91_9AGAR|nr:hypothetical protein GGX14DRAFT_556780 [Mycena pura]